MRRVYTVTMLAGALWLAPWMRAAGGMDFARLKLIPQRIQELVNSGTISGAVTLVARHGEVAALDAAGFQDVENRKPMRADSIMQIMSQTKSFTGVAAMMLVEEGKLDLQRPVRDYLPEFKDQMVEEKRPDGPVPAHRPAHPPTVGELMSHTSGLAFLPAAGPLKRINFTMDATLEEAVRGYARERLVHEPGTKYLYSNMGIATLGRIVEVVSGVDYARFVQSRILEPLGMRDTFFFPPEEKKSRIALVYQHDNGKLAPARDRAQGGDPEKYRAGARYPGPELALYSTATDLLRFYQMLANGGVYGGRRYLSKQTVEAMTRDYTPDHSGYGLTLSLMDKPQALLNLISPGTFGHGGAFGTGGWVDPKNGLVVIVLCQMNDGSAGAVRSAVWQIAEAAVE